MLCRRRYYAVGHHKAGLRPLCTDLYGPPAPQTAHHSNIVSCSRSHCAPGAFFHFGTPLPRCRGPPFSRIPATRFPQPGIKILGSMNNSMRWEPILQLSQKKPLSRRSNWRRSDNLLTGRNSSVNHIRYPRKYHAVTAAVLIAEKNKYPRRIGAVENMIRP